MHFELEKSRRAEHEEELVVGRTCQVEGTACAKASVTGIYRVGWVGLPSRACDLCSHRAQKGSALRLT